MGAPLPKKKHGPPSDQTVPDQRPKKEEPPKEEQKP
jgi:hypothetical protein